MNPIMTALRAIDRWLVKIARILVAIILFIQLVSIFFGVIFRYFFNSPLIWVDEIATNLLILVTFFGSYVALKERKLASVTILPLALNKKARKIVVLVANILVIILLILISYYSIYLCRLPVITKTLTPVLQWPMLVFYVMLPISTVMMTIHMIVALYDDFVNPNNEKDKEGELAC